MSAHPRTFRRLCVFCGSSKGARENYLHAAQQLGRELATRGIELVYGGGNVGLMGAVANAVLASGGRVTGVITEHLTTFEIGHIDIRDLRVVKTMHERKGSWPSWRTASSPCPVASAPTRNSSRC